MKSVRFTTPPAPCEYLPDRVARLTYEVNPALRPADYLARLRKGWRRFGYATFRPECPGCTMCQSLRVPVARFRPTAGQRRVWRKNEGVLTLRIGEPSSSLEKLMLWRKFHQHGHAVKGWPSAEDSQPGTFLRNPFPTEEWCYYLGDQLVGLGYVDALTEGLSAIYFCWDPDHAHRSPGTLNVLSIIASAQARGLPDVYLGYFVEGCRSLEYKARFRPNEVLGADGRWRQFRT